ncbi:MAG: PIN domain-containing protein [Candidatus Latescibacterota bacterium]
MALTLVDTSSWLHALRPGGDPDETQRVRGLLESGEVAWCPIVRLEPWNGARGVRGKRVLEEMSGELPDLPIDIPAWQIAIELAEQARSRGHTVPATDILILATARRHGTALEHADAHLATACAR